MTLHEYAENKCKGKMSWCRQCMIDNDTDDCRKADECCGLRRFWRMGSSNFLMVSFINCTAQPWDLQEEEGHPRGAVMSVLCRWPTWRSQEEASGDISAPLVVLCLCRFLILFTVFCNAVFFSKEFVSSFYLSVCIRLSLLFQQLWSFR